MMFANAFYSQSRSLGLVLWMMLSNIAWSASSQTPTNSQAQISALQAERNQAIEQVKKIVNQPVAAFQRQKGMRVGRYEGGWFHEGATKPNFKYTDVRATRETPYDKYEYVTSDLNPGMVFLARQLEFNSMTKYFYTDRTRPKKKLSENEMIEINRLYRVIGRCEEELARVQNPQGASSDAAEEGQAEQPSGKRPRLLNPYVGAGLLLLLLPILYFLRKG